MAHDILQPVIGLMLLTFVVWVRLYITRSRYIKANNINAQDVASPEMMNSLLPEEVNRPSNNLKNLFELPVIFYTVCLVLLVIDKVDILFIYLAWTFVVLRVVHSAIHCTINKVIPRLITYALSGLVLWIMVFRLALLIF